ncbi:NAD(+) diphosphatase [Asanoa sp. NPDC049518]|uniref:NAD(+) diphosphatase n=1 Tax=unclassified Asanoa TaxID=2685164 RepID=UPI00342FF24A
MSRFVPDAVATAPPSPSDHCVLVAGRRLLTPFPRRGDLDALPDDVAWVPLGALDGVRVWAAGLPERIDTLGRWRGWPAVAATLDEPLAALAGRALQIVTWRHSHRYCGACATELTDVPGEHARRCPGCDLYVPMQLSPAVLTAIRRGDEILLVKHTYGPKELWALVAGFVEAGESLEEAVHREVGEEVGLTVSGLRYFGSQPWAMSGPGVVLTGFLATAAPDAEPVVDGKELAEARWWPLNALPDALPPAYSISRWLIDAAVAESAR